MALRCDICDKKTVHGNQQIHRHSRWRYRAPKTKRTWVPNIRPVKITVKEGVKTIHMCMSCYKKYTQTGASFLHKKQPKALKKVTVE